MGKFAYIHSKASFVGFNSIQFNFTGHELRTQKVSQQLVLITRQNVYVCS